MLVTEERGRNKSKGPKNKENKRSKSNGKFANVECYHCSKKGHIKKHCRKLKKEYKKNKGEKKKSNDENRVATTIKDFLLMYDDDMINLAFNETSWVIDSGVTANPTFFKDFCISYTPDDFGVVGMGNNGVAKVVGRGNVCLKTHNGMTLLLKDVKHVPDN